MLWGEAAEHFPGVVAYWYVLLVITYLMTDPGVEQVIRDYRSWSGAGNHWLADPGVEQANHDNGDQWIPRYLYYIKVIQANVSDVTVI